MIQRIFVTLDTKKTNYKNVGKINHGDDLILELTVLSNGDMISFNDPMVDLLVKKSDGKMIRQNSGIEHIKPNKFVIEVSKDCVTSPGLTTNQLVINDNGRISTCMFYYTILNSLEEDIIQSISNVEVLEQLDEYVIEAQERMELLNNNINKLEEFFGATSDTLVEAEMARNEAEQKRVQSEILRINNENDRIEADNIRNQNDSIRNQNEVDRSSSELVREQRESERILNEEERRQNESERMIDESTRQQNENTRQSNESIRMSNEIDRKTQENRRVTAETNRVNAETTRRNNENSRISNESERQKAMNEMKSLLEDARGFDERVEVIEDEIEEINSSLDKMKSFITPIMFGAKGNDNEDDTMAIQNALNYCNENKVKLTIPKGIYIISDTLIANNVIIEGYSNSETILKMTSNKPLINMNGGSLENVRISNTGDYNNINLKGIVLGNKNLGTINTKVNLKNIYIETPFYDGIYSEVECDNTSISGINCFVNNKRSVIFIETGSSYPASACVKISDCHIYCRSQYGIYFRRGDNGSIYNNVVNNCDECICVVEHRNIEMLNNHIEHRCLQSAIRFEENKNVGVGDIIIPTEKNANGQVFEVITGGVITGTEKFDKFLIDGYGSTISYGNVVLKHISNAIGIRVSNVTTCNISGTFDSSIIGILIGRSNVTSLNINNVSYLGQCDKIIKNCVTGELCNLYINNSSLNGCFDFGDNANHSYKIENTVIINNSINKIGLSNKEKYIFNKEESNINIKTVSADYTVDFENDKIIYVDTSNSNGRVIITFPKTTSTYGKEVTIIKATSDNAYVRINPQDCIGNRDLLKQFDSITVKKLPAVKYMCVTGSYFNS